LEILRLKPNKRVTISLKVMLTCALRAQVNKFKMEIKNKFHIESITYTPSGPIYKRKLGQQKWMYLD
jgi:hypothetical protein